MLVTIVGLAVGGCGSDPLEAERDEVIDYINAVNAVHVDAAPTLEAARETYGRFAEQKLTGVTAQHRVEAIERRLQGIRGQVAMVPAPPQASRLRARTLEVYDANAAIAQQTVLMARYAVEEKRALATLPALGGRLERRLRTRRDDPEGQASALTAYAAGLHRVVGRVRRLRPPLLLRPARDAQADRLTRSRSIALRLRAAILVRDPETVVELLDRFESVNRRPVSRRAVKAAFRSYRRYHETLGYAERAVHTETAHLNGRYLDQE
ncbi:MAG: hypothetical protein AB7G37_11820 [Solirubrobacteraceae bacterium]